MPSRTVAIVGRPNVGKSALFNRLAGRRISIVHDMPGVTRDRISAECRLAREPFEILDTGGIGSEVDADFTSQVRAEVDIAVETCDLLLFVVDAHEGVTPVDLELAKLLRRANKQIVLVANKVDDPKHLPHAAEFSRLGFDPVVMVSAEHNRGIAELVDRIDILLPTPDAEEFRRDQVPVKVAIVGRPNVGKSSLTNAILQDERTLVSPISGTTRDAIDIPYRRGEQEFILIDTAGIRPRGKVNHSVEVFSVMRSEESIRRADLCCLVIDASMGVTAQDKKIAGLIQEARRPCVIAVNKWDLIEERTSNKEELQETLQEFESELFFLDYAPLFLLSAKTGASLERLFKRIENIREASRKRINTGALNRLIAAALTQQPPAHRLGKRFKILYATQPEPKNHSPIPLPEIVIFCNNGKLLDAHYRRFLEGRIRKEQAWDGLPMILHFRDREERGGGGKAGKR